MRQNNLKIAGRGVDFFSAAKSPSSKPKLNRDSVSETHSGSWRASRERREGRDQCSVKGTFVVYLDVSKPYSVKTYLK